MTSTIALRKWSPAVQYIPRNMHTLFALLCFVVVIHWLIFPYPSGLLHWHCGNLTIAPVPAKQPWWIWTNTSCEFIMNDCVTTTKQSTSAAFLLCVTLYPYIAMYRSSKVYMPHYSDVIIGAVASQIISFTIVHFTVYTGADQRKHQSSASLAFVWGIFRWPVNYQHKMASNAENISISWRHCAFSMACLSTWFCSMSTYGDRSQGRPEAAYFDVLVCH